MSHRTTKEASHGEERHGVLLCALFLAVASFAATRPVFPEQFGETLEVRIISVDVVVRDLDGRVLRGLTADDFLLYENGRSQPISHFAEYRGGPPSDARAEEAGPLTAPSAPAKRYLLFFVDNLNLRETENRAEFFSGLRALVRNGMREGDEAAVFRWRTSLEASLPMTSDSRAVLDEIARIELDSRLQIDPTEIELSELAIRSRMNREAENSTTEEMEDRRFAARRAFDLQQRKVNAINHVIQSVAGLDGRKVMILATDRLTKMPGLEYGYGEIGEIYDDPGKEEVYGRSFHREFNARRQIDSVVRNANSAGVTIYAFFPKGIDKEHPSITATESTQSRSWQLLMNQGEAIDSIAARTGGASALGGQNSRLALAEMVEDLANYYSLAYRPQDNRIDRRRDIRVEVKRPDVRVRARTAVVDKSEGEVLHDGVVSSLFHGAAPSSIPIQVTQRGIKRDGSRRTVVVDITVPVAQLTMLRGETGYEGRFGVLAVATSADGAVSDVAEKDQPFRIPDREYARAIRGTYTYNLEVEVRDTSTRMAIALVDRLDGETGYATLELDLDAPPPRFKTKVPDNSPAWLRDRPPPR